MRLPAWDVTATSREQCDLLRALIGVLRPEVVVEAGTYKGHAAFFMGHSLSDIGAGHLWTADPIDHGVARLVREWRLEQWVTYQQRDFLDVLAELPVVDFAYIDASADGPTGAELRWRHFQAVLSKLRPGGVVCVDDTATDDWCDGEGGRSVERIRAVCGLNFRFGSGLSIYHSPGP